jgi:hypothetical protein
MVLLLLPLLLLLVAAPAQRFSTHAAFEETAAAMYASLAAMLIYGIACTAVIETMRRRRGGTLGSPGKGIKSFPGAIAVGLIQSLVFWIMILPTFSSYTECFGDLSLAEVTVTDKRTTSGKGCHHHLLVVGRDGTEAKGLCVDEDQFLAAHVGTRMPMIVATSGVGRAMDLSSEVIATARAAHPDLAFDKNGPAHAEPD